MSVLSTLQKIRGLTRQPTTLGLSDSLVERFAELDPKLGQAVAEALPLVEALAARHPELFALSEAELVRRVQEGFVNFYKDTTVNPYVAVSARGPWVVTAHGAVVHDSGGYGMLGMGHNPQAVLDVLGRPQVMANVMTANFSQQAFVTRMRRELGHTRAGGPSFHSFVCLNSGSESMTLARRLADVNARRQTAAQGVHPGRTIKALAVRGGFHGRTDGPARISDSCRDAYEKHLASFVDHSDLVTVPQNDVAALDAAFEQAQAQGWFFDAVYMEPVQGEGAPGRAITRAFYDRAVHLARAMGSLVVVDSIQAGLRAHGVLSIIDYPGFQDAEVPDVETWSKALNAGQFPLSVLGLSERAAQVYVNGIYGNTMTTNPRALDIASLVLDSITPQLRENIQRQGRRFLQGLEAIQRRLPGVVREVQGTGLLFCAELFPQYPVVAPMGVETQCRIVGLGVIHGGENALRFTPHFGITDAEVDMMLELVEQVLSNLKPTA